jgi:uncharacterized membrane protein YwaF
VGDEKFNIFQELPLHLCNIKMFLIPLALMNTEREGRWERGLLAFCFFSTPAGAVMALASPLDAFDTVSLLLPRAIGYYGIHGLLAIAGAGIVSLGLYRPQYRDIPVALLLMLSLVLISHLVNAVFRVSDLASNANYFFTFDPQGTMILTTLWRLLPIPLVYELPLIPIVLAYAVLLTGLTGIINRYTQTKQENAPRTSLLI